jgi:hypothetical protein
MPRCTGAGEDNGIDHHQKSLRFPYDSTFLPSHYLHLHPYVKTASDHHLRARPDLDDLQRSVLVLGALHSCTTRARRRATTTARSTDTLN